MKNIKHQLFLKIEILLILFVLLNLSCSLKIADRLNIIGYSPNCEQLTLSENHEIYIEFSTLPFKESAEKCFEFLEDGYPVSGIFEWQKNKMIFHPDKPLEENREYRMMLLQSAETKDGFSIRENFIFRFRTGTDKILPEIQKWELKKNSEGDIRRQCLNVIFNKPVKIPDLRNTIEIRPFCYAEINEAETQGQDSFTYSILFPDNLLPEQTYQVTIPSGIRDLFGLKSNIPGFYSFTTKAELDPTRLLKVVSLNSNIQIPILEFYQDGTNSSKPGEYFNIFGIKKKESIQINFSAPILIELLKRSISFSPSIQFELIENTPEVFVLTPVEEYQFNETYLVTIGEEINPSKTGNLIQFRFTANNEADQSPVLEKIFLQQHTGSDAQPLMKELLNNDCISEIMQDYNIARNGYLDFQIYFAPGDSFNLKSFINNILIITASIAEFDIRTITTLQVNSQTIKIRCECKIKNNPRQLGLMRIGLQEGFEGTSGNKINKDIAFVFSK